MPTSVASASSCAQARGSAISAALLRRSGCRSPIRAISTPRRSPAPCRPARMARGIGLGCLSSQAVGMRLVQPDGSVFEVDADRDPETMAAAQVSIGTLGVISTITLQAVSAYNLKEKLWRDDFESCMERHDDLAVIAGAKMHRFPEQKCINNADENGLEHGLFSWASGLGRIVGRRVGVVAA